MHIYTLIQVFCVALLFAVKLSEAAVSYPIIIVLLIPGGMEAVSFYVYSLFRNLKSQKASGSVFCALIRQMVSLIRLSLSGKKNLEGVGKYLSALIRGGVLGQVWGYLPDHFLVMNFEHSKC